MAREPGWYPHRWRSVWRYWDGSTWTEETPATTKVKAHRAEAAAAMKAPGWYPDANMPGTRRYWDGAGWTDNVAPMDTSSQAAGFWTLTRAVALGILVAIACIWVVYTIAHSNDSLNCSLDNVDRAQNGQPLLVCPDN